MGLWYRIRVALARRFHRCYKCGGPVDDASRDFADLVFSLKRDVRRGPVHYCPACDTFLVYEG